MKPKTIGVVLAGCWLAMLVVAVPSALAAPGAAGPASVKATAPEAAVQVCKRLFRCVVRCRMMSIRRRCRPGSLCRFQTHLTCRCYRVRGRCGLRCQSKTLTRRCTRYGYCSVGVKRCHCERVPLPPHRPSR
ncbi:MAG: hypothetical protein KJ621_00735 [Proteobacteria bacterium]|nr:hypothetical protein [Pseudomonadota bacterium]